MTPEFWHDLSASLRGAFATKQSMAATKAGIASSQALLAMTEELVAPHPGPL
jgi:hypothetical protein